MDWTAQFRAVADLKARKDDPARQRVAQTPKHGANVVPMNVARLETIAESCVLSTEVGGVLHHDPVTTSWDFG
jgi:hypothetical protein